MYHPKPIVHTSSVSHKNEPYTRNPIPASCESSGIWGCNYGVHYAAYAGSFSIGIPGLWSPGEKADPGGGDENVRNVNDEGLIDEPCSFTSQTRVATQGGKQSIGTVQVGEKVWAYNPRTKKMELQPILHVWIHQDNDLVDLTITQTTQQGKATKRTNEVIHTNKKHPFLTVEKGFLPVGQIKLGMHVVKAYGAVGVITGWKLVPGVQTMYNLEVAQDHTFTVGVGMWVVHNCGGTEMDPNNIGFTQGEISDQGNGYTVTGNIDQLKAGTLDPNQMGNPIRVFQKTPEMNSWGPKTKYGYTGDPENLIDGAWYSLDNRRLYAFQQAGVERIAVQVVDDLAIIKNQRWKFDTTSWGIDITLRRG